MARVGLISIDLVANTGKLLAPLRKASAGISAFASGVTSVRLGFGSALASITAFTGGAISLAAAVGKVKHEFGQIDEIAKEAERLGTTTETLAGLRHAAELAGVSAEELGTALQHMLRHGLRITDLGKIADRIAATTDPITRMQFAIATFGKGGAGMLNVLSEGSAGLEKMRKEAERLGLTFSKIDAAKVEAANDAVTRLKAVFTGLARTIAVDISPFVEALANRMTEFATSGESAGKTVRAAMDGIVTGIGFVLDAIYALQVGWKTLQAIAQTAISGMVLLLADLVKVSEIVAESIVNAFQIAANFIAARLLETARNVAAFLRDLGLPGADEQAGRLAAAAAILSSKQAGTLDLTFGDSAKDFADEFAKEMKDAWRDLGEFASREMPSKGLKRDVERIRRDAEAAAAAAAGGPAADALGPSRQNLAALERGSQEAFSAFQEGNKLRETTDKKALEIAKKSEEHLRAISKSGLILKAAGI